jgi:hypothetical protein
MCLGASRGCTGDGSQASDLRSSGAQDAIASGCLLANLRLSRSPSRFLPGPYALITVRSVQECLCRASNDCRRLTLLKMIGAPSRRNARLVCPWSIHTFQPGWPPIAEVRAGPNDGGLV